MFALLSGPTRCWRKPIQRALQHPQAGSPVPSSTFHCLRGTDQAGRVEFGLGRPSYYRKGPREAEELPCSTRCSSTKHPQILRTANKSATMFLISAPGVPITRPSSKQVSTPVSNRWTRRKPARPCGCETASRSCRTAHMPARRNSWVASCCSSCHHSMWHWHGRRAARPPHMAPWKSDRSIPNCSDASKVKTSADKPTYRAVEAAARQSYGRLVALLSARTRDTAGAEDALADALLAALNTWGRDGIPKNPQAWLLTAARNRLLDHARHLEARERSASTLETLANELCDAPDPDALPDERLKLLFVCAHPAIAPDMHTPLMLQTVLGLDAVEIGRAFLVSPKTMGQRLARAKTKIRRARIAFEIPAADQIPQRLEAVLNAIYAAYGSSWEEAGRDQRAVGLAEEAIWLARVLRDAIPDEPEARGLLALLLHCEARRPARRGADGRYVPLSEQDPHIWLAALIDEAERELAVSARHARLGRFQIEAAIQSVHADRARTGRTAWVAIATFDDQLMHLAPSIGAAVARAAAHTEVCGAQAGLVLLDQIDVHSVISYQPYWAVRAELMRRLNCAHEAVEAFDRAIGLTDDDAIRAFLLERRGR